MVDEDITFQDNVVDALASPNKLGWISMDVSRLQKVFEKLQFHIGKSDVNKSMIHPI
jgi:hypothetical protein